MKQNLQASNNAIRLAAYKGQQTLSGLSNGDVNNWLRTGVFPKTPMNAKFRAQVKHLMEADRSLTLAEAQEQVVLFEAEHPDPHKQMNTYIRTAAGRVKAKPQKEDQNDDGTNS